jgi:hypothetical protein
MLHMVFCMVTQSWLRKRWLSIAQTTVCA